MAGTRPEAVKLAPVILALHARGLATRLVATGQHRQLFIEALAGFDLAPDLDLDIMRPRQSPADVVGALVPLLSAECARARPAAVIVQGDTASAFAGAVAAAYAGCPIAHVEAGLRSGQRDPFPEEMHRRAIAQLADLHFAPTPAAAQALAREGIAAAAIHVTGNTGIDALHETRRRLAGDADARDRLAMRFAAIDRRRPLVVATVHRRENHGRPLAAILDAITALAEIAEVVLPVHPSPDVAGPVQARLAGVTGVHLLPPLDYPAFVWLLGQATLALTDSGGVQEEAPALGVPVLVLRQATERPEGVASGNARLVGTDTAAIVTAVRALLADAGALGRMAEPALPYGAGDAAVRIAGLLAARFGSAGTQPLQHGDEAGKAGGDRPGIVDGDRLAGMEAEHGEAHGDAMIEFGSDGRPAAHGLAA
ncbi:UDP-N-acetylglucosamine 2-epimerase (non-hydrolysing) [Polymorphobacter fuscus]|nr:UDP-N-acetylglucosamine 2-epimerase (non-hydrolysing) [Polymorphobacter fuscus]